MPRGPVWCVTSLRPSISSAAAEISSSLEQTRMPPALDGKMIDAASERMAQVCLASLARRDLADHLGGGASPERVANHSAQFLRKAS